MKTIKQVEVTPVFCEDGVPEIPSQYEEGKVYISKNRDWIAHNCLCGCGSFIMLPVNQNPQGWQLEVDDNNKISLIGSILQYECKAHYIITKNKANFV